MNETISTLYQLEELDRKIFEIRRQMGNLPLKRSELKEKYDAIDSNVNSLKAEIENLKKANMEMEEENASFREKIESDKEYLKTVKSNEEYMMILEGKDNKEKTIKENENTILKNMQKIEDIEKKLSEHNNDDLEKLQKQLEEINKQLENDEKEIVILNQQRESLIRSLSENIAKKYIRIYEKRDGLPIVLVDKAYCTGCFSEIPEQLLDDVRSMDKIQYCTQCGRILLLKKHENNG